MRQLWEVVLQLEAQLRRQEGEGFHQALHIGVATPLAQQPGKLWIVLGEVVPKFMEVAQLFAESIFERHRLPHSGMAVMAVDQQLQLQLLRVIIHLHLAVQPEMQLLRGVTSGHGLE